MEISTFTEFLKNCLSYSFSLLAPKTLPFDLGVDGVSPFL